MRWIVGLDLRPLCTGALRFAKWLASASHAPGGERCTGIHVLEEQHLLAVLRYHHLPEVLERARASAEAILLAEQCGKVISGVEVLQGASVPEVLEAARLKLGADGTIIGRAAGVAGTGVVRLGRSARRVLRAAAAPVIVVPPDLGPSGPGNGPVLALTDLQPGSVAACEFAAAFAGALGRPWALLHVAPIPEEFAPASLPVVSLEGMRSDFLTEGKKGLAAWIAAHGLRPDASEVLQGPILDCALASARAKATPLLVAGSRRLSTLERTLVPSVSSELAGSAPVPVAVVPPRG
jgi:nucleotide-binding universal stress UspA family protein